MLTTIKQKIYRWLKWLERYTKTDMVYLTKGSGWLAGGKIINNLASLFLAIAFANLVDKQTYGDYKYILSLFSILAIFSLSGLATSVVRSVAKGLEGSFHQAVTTSLKWGLTGSLISLVLGIYYWLAGNSAIAISLLLGAIFLPLTNAFIIYLNLLQGKKLFNYSVKYTALTNVISATLLITCLFITKNLIYIVAVYLISNAALSLFFHLKTNSKFKPNQQLDPETISYGKNLTVMDIISTVASYLDRLLVFHYLGAIELAIYSFAITPPEQIKGFIKNIQDLALPKLSVKNNNDIGKNIILKTTQLAGALILITIIYIILAPYFYKLIFPQYVDSIFYSQLFALGLIPCAAAIPEVALRAKADKKRLYQLSIYSPIIQILIMAGLLYYAGLVGIIWARIIGRSINAIIVLWLFKKTNQTTT